MTMDPLAEDNYSVSPYTYVDNNPIRWIDPDGMKKGDPDDPIQLPEVEITPSKVLPSKGDPILSPTSNPWYFLFDRTYERNLQVGDNSQTITYYVDHNGRARSNGSIIYSGIAPTPSTKKIDIKKLISIYRSIKGFKRAKVLYGGKYVSVFRGGNSLKVRPSDIKIDNATGLLQPSHGVSVNINPSAVERFGGAYKVKSLPEGLKIIQRGPNNPEHFEIVPAYEMTLENYQSLLNQINIIP